MNKFLIITLFFFTTSIYSAAQGSWDLLNPTPSYRTGVDIHFFSTEHGYIITGEYQILETTDAGETWEVKHTFSGYDDFEDFAFFNSVGFIVGENGYVLKTTDSGDTWAEISIGISQDLHTVNMIDSEVIIISSSNKLAKSIDGGTSWMILDIPNETVNSIFFIDAEVGHAACNNGTILKTIDGGLNWYATEEGSAFPSGFLEIYFFNELIGYASRESNDLYKTEDAGETWVMIPGITDLFYTMQFTSENIGYAGGGNGAIFKTIDGGSHWEWISFQDDRYDFTSVYGLYFFDENIGFTVGNKGRITQTIDGGETWTEYSPIYDIINQIDFPTNEIGYARVRKEIFKTTDAGITWENIGRPLANKKTKNFHFVNENIGYIIVGGESISDPSEYIYKTIDGGVTWSVTNDGNFLEEEINLISVDFINENIGYASGNRFAATTRVFQTTDGGNTWLKVGEKRLLQMQFITETLGYGIGGFQNFLYRTTNGGATWEEYFEADAAITDFHFVDSDNGYIVAWEGLMYKTKNAGADWQQLVNVPLTALEKVAFTTKDIGYLSTGDKIYSTENGGQTWAFSVQIGQITDVCATDEKIYIGGSNGEILSSDHIVVSNQEVIRENDFTITLSPNPTREYVYISSEGKSKITSIAVFDITGKEIQIEQLVNNNNVQLTLPQKVTGTFIVQITLDNKYLMSKTLIVH